MKVPHNARVVVADGRKMLFFRNEGDEAYPNLVVESAEERINPADRDQKTDKPGTAYASSGTARSSMEEVDFHRRRRIASLRIPRISSSGACWRTNMSR